METPLPPYPPESILKFGSPRSDKLTDEFPAQRIAVLRLANIDGLRETRQADNLVAWCGCPFLFTRKPRKITCRSTAVALLRR